MTEQNVYRCMTKVYSVVIIWWKDKSYR